MRMFTSLHTALDVRRWASDEGATAVEYALMVALIAGVIIAAVFALGGAASQTFQDCATAIETAPTGTC